MKGLVRSVPYLLEQGYTIELWAWKVQPELEELEGVTVWKPFPFLSKFGILSTYLFQLVVSLASIKRRFFRAQKDNQKEDLIFTTQSICFGAHVSQFQFSQYDWLKWQLKLKPDSLRSLVKLPLCFIATVLDFIQINNPLCNKLISSSFGTANDVRAQLINERVIEIVPNSYEPDQFNLEERAKWREQTRAKLSYDDNDIVFSFLSMGHHFRKGFWLAVKALAKARKNGASQFKFMVIGGTDQTIDRLKLRIKNIDPNFDEWIVFLGPRKDYAELLTASDGLLFPSYSEGFSLAVIEAAGLGTPLYLTPHNGSEMILKEGVNGYLLPYNIDEIAKVLSEKSEVCNKGHDEMGYALSETEYAKQFEEVISNFMNYRKFY